MNIIEDNKQKLELYKNKPIHSSYISGLLDGDGTIFIRKINDGFQSGISLCQSRTNILQILRFNYGGIITKPTNIFTEDIFNEYGYYDTNNKRNSYTLIIRSNEYEFLLEYIKDSIILKKNQISYLKEFSELVNKTNKLEQKEKLYLLCSQQNSIKTQESYDYSKLNIEYIQGLFDAEGHIFVSFKKKDNIIRFTKSVYMKITQKSHTGILYEIQNFLGFGKVDGYNFYVDNFDDCSRFVTLIKDGLIIKYNQIIAFEEYLKTYINKNEKYTDIIHQQRERLYKIINMEKHQIEVYKSIEPEPKQGLNLKINERNEQIKIEKEIKLYTHTKVIQSEKKMGLLNPNYGKEMSEDHKSKISITNMEVKRGEKYSDEKIKEIFNLKGGIMLQKDVAEKYDCNREIIRRIWNEEMVPSDHPNYGKCKDNKPKKDTITSSQKTSETKKTLDNDAYIEIILWKKKKINGEKLDGKLISSPKLSEYLSKKYNQKVTVDIIKNIWCGKTKLHDFNFKDNNEISYDEYISIISSK